MTSSRTASATQARILLDSELLPLLALLMTGDRSVREIQEALNLTPNRALYLVTKLERAGVAFVQDVQARAGRGIKRYAVPERWFIPFQVTDAATLQQLGEHLTLPHVKGMLLDAALNFREYPEIRSGYWLQGGQLRLGDVSGPYLALPEPLLLHFLTLQLTLEQASDLQVRLLALLTEFETRQHEQARTYSLGLLLVRKNTGS